MKEGDYIVGINEHDVKWSPHDEVVALIKSSGNTLKLKVVTPMDGKEKVRRLVKRLMPIIKLTKLIRFVCTNHLTLLGAEARP